MSCGFRLARTDKISVLGCYGYSTRFPPVEVYLGVADEQERKDWCRNSHEHGRFVSTQQEDAAMGLTVVVPVVQQH